MTILELKTVILEVFQNIENQPDVEAFADLIFRLRGEGTRRALMEYKHMIDDMFYAEHVEFKFKGDIGITHSWHMSNEGEEFWTDYYEQFIRRKI